MPKDQPFELPDDECERMTRKEMALCQMIMCLASNLHYAKDDLRHRMDTIPYGMRRLNMVIGGIDSLFKDLIGTISDRQRKKLRNSAKDMVIQLVPKLTANKDSILISVDEVRELTDCAMEKCKNCADTGEEARKCRLYKWLETNIPLDDYGDDLVCPYARQEWG